ncbi:putative DNA modification/repair radical SAM protein [Roseomonas sp. E05]|uniref:putative DNA modification/repair radical SAM protein n=1 Tax=Roseomonas sp. E05 TaxID=3046310 RepID=UPI0024B8B3D4|nr:putative DNA modification/repair radical SAM protein [Roseomonas sp. E05]MDJ0386862.1 putative DNA modification/repair radical SAM protein [Roseomonas sp. E05]
MDLRAKLALLADAAKYDASCASSGTEKRDSRVGGLGSTEGMGICHAYAPDGRCVSLLKVLLTNSCIFDCAYCINRKSSDVRRARFTVEELVKLTISFYRRNYIEGLFLSSGIIRNSDYTMEQLIRVARTLREAHGFLGYIHLKTIPDAAPELLAEAGRWADRLSINIELPQARSLKELAPEKDLDGIHGAMGDLSGHIAEAKEAARTPTRAAPPRFAPAGQSTQMIIGADDSDDRHILGTSDALYKKFGLKRVYYSGFSPIPDASAKLPPAPPPLLREHRLYQADWLLRFYGFGTQEILSGGEGGMLDLELDPKLAWALKHRALFPLDLNRASREALLRVPGLGARNVERILAARRHSSVRLADLARLRVPLKKISPFILAPDHRPGRSQLDSAGLRRQLLAPSAFAQAAKPRQLALDV